MINLMKAHYQSTTNVTFCLEERSKKFAKIIIHDNAREWKREATEKQRKQ